MINPTAANKPEMLPPMTSSVERRPALAFSNWRVAVWAIVAGSSNFESSKAIFSAFQCD
jgi:hypothetical protein